MEQQPNRVLRCIRRVARTMDSRTEPDQALLQRFVAGRDEAAFATLLRRHGPMVLRVARRTLQNEHDAEDVFQATFLVLSRKAQTLRRQESLASWLYGIAYRLALKTRATAGQRRTRERRAATKTAATPVAQITVQEAQAILDEELSRLPEKFRVPVVLCCLEGLARDEAAHQLGCPASVLKSRLEQARERLRQRLVARGLTLPCGLGAFLLLEGVGGAAVSPALLDSTTRAALTVAAGKTAASVVSPKVAALIEGVVNAMLLTKLKIAAIVLAVTLIGAGAGLLTYRTLAGDKASAAAVAQDKAKADQRAEERRIVGQVLDYAGKPLEGASVFLVGSGHVRIWRGKAVRWLPSGDEIPPDDNKVPAGITDQQGRFTLAEADGPAQQVAVSCRMLDLWVVPAPKKGEELIIRLPQPARLVIRYDIEGAHKEARLHLDPSARGYVEFQRDPRVANKGQVILEDLAPGQYELSRYRHGCYCDRRTVILAPGERVESHFIRERGQPVTGSVVGIDLTKIGHTRVRVLRGTATGNPRAYDEWMTVYDAFACGADGKFVTERLTPGTYTIAAEAYLPLTKEKHTNWGSLPFPDFAGVAKVTVAADKPPMPLRIEMKPTAQRIVNEEIQKLIKQLDDNNFQIREQATKELKALGSAIVPLLEAALEQAQSPELRRRLEHLLEPYRARPVPDLEQLQGTWKLVAAQKDGKEWALKEVSAAYSRLTFAGLTYKRHDGTKGNIKLNTGAKPKEITLEGLIYLYCIYDLDGDTLRICFNTHRRPTAFATSANSDTVLFTYQRDSSN